MQVKISQASSMITKAIKAKLVPMMIGSPGLGKSSIVHQIAAVFNLLVIDLRMSQLDPTDLGGFPHIINGRATYVPMSTFPIEGDALPCVKDKDGKVIHQYNGWLLFLDEFTSAIPAVQAAAYKIVLDRMVGQEHLHKNVAIVCAGNKDTDNAIVHSMSTALQSRLVHLELVLDMKEWLSWAIDNQFDYRITSYVEAKPDHLYTFDPDHSDHTYACPRTWEFANRILKVTDDEDPDRQPLLAGAISDGVASELMAFFKIHKELPTISAIINQPEAIMMPNNPGILFALTGSISHNADPDNFSQLVKFISRMPVEFQVVTMRATLKRKPALMGTPEMQKWVSANAKELF